MEIGIMNYLLDTNIVSLAIKQNLQILQRILIADAKEENIFISCITYFEIRRGFLAVDHPKQRARFEDFCQRYPIILSEDILIVATAIIKDLIVVSNDTDLARIEGLNLENWVELSF